MRRFAAVALLAFFSLSLMSSLALSDGASSLPACCRNDGKHRCAMRSGTDLQQSAPGMTGMAVSRKCPYFPAGAAPAHPLTVLLKASPTIFASVLSHPAVQPQTEARYRISFSRSRQKRGPPALHS